MRNTIARTLCTAATLSLLALAGCEQIDPLTRPYMWHPDNAVANNMAAMAANPDDLVRGRETRVRRARMEADGVERIWTGKQLPLLGSGGGGGGAPVAGGGGSPPAGGGT